MAYIDGLVIPVPSGNWDAYRARTKKAAPVFLEHGATSSRRGVPGAGRPGMGYRLRSIVDVDGLMKLPERDTDQSLKPIWLGYIGVDDVEAAVES